MAQQRTTFIIDVFHKHTKLTKRWHFLLLLIKVNWNKNEFYFKFNLVKICFYNLFLNRYLKKRTD